jgi:hypothetical protein
MSENTAAPDVTGANVELSDAQMDRYFETKGETSLGEDSAESNVSESVSQKAAETQEVRETGQKSQVVAEKEKFVPYGALHEEREKRKELQRSQQESQERIRQMEARFQQVVERISQPQVAEPTFDEDPLTALRNENEKIKRHLYQQSQSEQQRYAMEEQQRRFVTFQSQYENSAREYIKEQPDFMDAYHQLAKGRLDEFQAAGYTKDQANQLLIEDEAAIVARAYQDGVNPAERMYALARARGYSPKAAQLVSQQANQRLEEVERGLEASKSVSQAGGGRADKGLTLEALVEMDDEEFDKNWTKTMRQYK